ncbi:MAG: ABC transporter permease [Planctomycetota bacterium]|nr:ABC transporter permease [Planctomycetota bacterium]
MTPGFLLRRLLLAIPALLGASLIVSALLELSPAATSLTPQALDAPDAAMTAHADPLEPHQPFATRYLRWMHRLSPLRAGTQDRLDDRGSRIQPPPPVPHARGAPADYAGPAPDSYADAALAHARDRARYAAALAADDESPDLRTQADRSRRAAHRALLSAPLPRAGLAIIPDSLWLDVPDLGWSSLRGRPVAPLLASALSATLLVNCLALFIAALAGIPTGLLAAVRPGPVDALLRAVLVGLWSMPVVWSAVMLQTLLARQAGVPLFPASGLMSPDAPDMGLLPGRDPRGVPEPGLILDIAWHLVLPVACLSLAALAVISRHTRAAALEQLAADHVRAARARGLAGPALLTRHVLRPALAPLAGLVAVLFPALVSGSVIIENVFNIPGMGRLLLDAVIARDRDLLLGCVMTAALAAVAASLLADALAACADPRVRFTGSNG